MCVCVGGGGGGGVDGCVFVSVCVYVCTVCCLGDDSLAGVSIMCVLCVASAMTVWPVSVLCFYKHLFLTASYTDHLRLASCTITMSTCF